MSEIWGIPYPYKLGAKNTFFGDFAT